MTTYTPREDEEQTNEQVNTTAKKKDPNLPERLVRKFLDAKLIGGSKGVGFYNQAKADHCAGALEEFKAYYQERKEGSDPESAQVINTVEKKFLYREMIRIGVTFESKRKTLSDILAREFDLPSDANKIKKEVEELSLDALDKHLKDRNQRRSFVDRVFVGQEVIEHDMAEQLKNIVGGKTLTPEQQASMERVFVSPRVKQEDLDAVFRLFSTDAEKQLIIKFFLPTVTLQYLQDANVLSPEQVRTAIRRSIEENHLGTDFPLNKADMEKLINSIEPEDITITTALFPGPVVDAILGTKEGKNVIRREIQAVNNEFREQIRADSDIGLVPDEEGRLLPSFQEKLKELGIQNAGLFQQGNFIHGKTTLSDGTTQSFYFAIDAIDDDPKTSAPDRASGLSITLKNVLATDGKSINTHWQKNPGDPYTYAEIFAVIQEAVGQTKNKTGEFAISTPSDMQSSIAHGTMEQKTLRSDLDTIEELRSAIDEVDKPGAAYGLDEGTSIQLGKPEDSDFQVFTVRSIDKKNKTITISNGYDKGDAISFEMLFDAFSTGKLTRLPKMDSPDAFLAALQTQGEKKDAFKDIIYDSSRGFILRDKKDDRDFPSIVQFAGSKETISLFGGTDPMKHGWDKGVWTDKDTKDGKKSGEYDKDARHYQGSWNTLYAHFLQTRATPRIHKTPMKAPEKMGEHMHDHGGFLSAAKGLLRNPSLHDMFVAVKNIKDMVKHSLEHGSKHEAAKFQLAIGEKLGFTDGMMRELRNKVYGTTRELMEEVIKDLGNMATKERAKEVEHILSDPRSPDYEVQAAALSMLKKHGTLYVSDLLKYQWSFKFFERITGQKYHPDNELVRKYTKRAEDDGVVPREEFMIQCYLKEQGDAYKCDDKLWGQIRDSWREGINGEKESGEKQADVLDTLSARLTLVKGKLRGWEIAQWIGAMGKVWAKGGGPHGGASMHLPAIYLALSNIPKTLHTTQTNQLYNEFLSNGHPYPALAFLRNEEHVELFQRVVKKLCESSKDGDMKNAYSAVESARKRNNQADAIDAIESFWNKYGDVLHKKLVMSEDPEILYRAKTDPDFHAYVEWMEDFTHKLEFNKDEVTESAYVFSHSSHVWNAQSFLQHNLKVNQSSGVLGADEASKMAWRTFVDGVKAVKAIHVDEDEAKNRAFQQERFGEYYKAFNSIIINNLPPEKFEIIGNQPYMEELSRLGFSIPKTQQESDFDTPAYKAQIAEDFEAYMSGGRAMKQTDKVATHASDILKQTGYTGSRAANDDSARQAKAA